MAFNTQIGITAKFKNFFLDRAHIIKKIGEVRIKRLMRGGGRIRITAQRSMRRRLKASKPGTPPSAHWWTGEYLRKLLFFVYDYSTDSVVIGPVGFKKNEAPRANEFGGTFKRSRRGKVQTVTYPPRPFMEPALRKMEAKLPNDWSNSVVGP